MKQDHTLTACAFKIDEYALDNFLGRYAAPVCAIGLHPYRDQPQLGHLLIKIVIDVQKWKAKQPDGEILVAGNGVDRVFDGLIAAQDLVAGFGR